MRYDVSPLIPASIALILLLSGFWLRSSGGRPMLFGSMVLWGISVIALLLGVAFALPLEKGLHLVHLLMRWWCSPL